MAKSVAVGAPHLTSCHGNERCTAYTGPTVHAVAAEQGCGPAGPGPPSRHCEAAGTGTSPCSSPPAPYGLPPFTHLRRM
jgi:hypothetical protein